MKKHSYLHTCNCKSEPKYVKWFAISRQFSEKILIKFGHSRHKVQVHLLAEPQTANLNKLLGVRVYIMD